MSDQTLVRPKLTHFLEEIEQVRTDADRWSRIHQRSIRKSLVVTRNAKQQSKRENERGKESATAPPPLNTETLSKPMRRLPNGAKKSSFSFHRKNNESNDRKVQSANQCVSATDEGLRLAATGGERTNQRADLLCPSGALVRDDRNIKWPTKRNVFDDVSFFGQFHQIYTEFYTFLPAFTGFYWVLLGFIKFHWALLGFTRFHQI